METKPATDNKPEAVSGYLKTEADCPYCEYDNVYDGHVAHETVKCEGCGRDFEIGNTA